LVPRRDRAKFNPGLRLQLGEWRGSEQAAQAEAVLQQDPFTGHLFVFRGRRGDLVKVIWWDGQGACMFLKRLEKGRFVWPSAKEGKVALSPAQLSMLLEGIDWRAPQRTWRPLAAG
jgi:transposase